MADEIPVKAKAAAAPVESTQSVPLLLINSSSTHALHPVVKYGDTGEIHDIQITPRGRAQLPAGSEVLNPGGTHLIIRSV